MTTSSGKYLEDFLHGHKVSPMHEVITSAKDTDDLFIGFYRGRKKRRDKLTNNKNKKVKNHV